jgi:hypothetical protein
MFLPFCNDFCSAFREHPSNFGCLMCPKAAIKGNREVVHSDLTFGAALEYVHMDSLGEIITVKAHTIAILDKNRRH